MGLHPMMTCSQKQVVSIHPSESGSMTSMDVDNTAGAKKSPWTKKIAAVTEVVSELDKTLVPKSSQSQARQPAGCTGLQLLNFNVPKNDNDIGSVQIGCCPDSQSYCAGCAQTNSNGCLRCSGGFVLRGSNCTACSDSAGWRNFANKTCRAISTSECNDVKVLGE